VILTDREIQLALEKKQIFIDPLPPVDHYTSTSVDLTLDPDLTIFNDDLEDDALENIIDPSHKTFIAERIIARISKRILIDQGGYVLTPKKLILGSTRERIELPIHARLAARVEGKSSLARLGLGVHITAPTIHSGFGNPIRLEIVNQRLGRVDGDIASGD
jgi:dCTP deaminase